MLSERSRLLILLILLTAVATAGWTTALAGGKTGPSTVFLSSSSASLSKPPAVPASGEPDVGQTPRSATPHDSKSAGPRGEDGTHHGSDAGAWLDWILRVWTDHFFKVK
jgi:hypothetical protein